MRRTLLLVLILALSAIACTFIWCSYHRYYCVVANQLTVYRTDRLSGRVWIIRHSTMEPVVSDDKIAEYKAQYDTLLARYRALEAENRKLKAPVPGGPSARLERLRALAETGVDPGSQRAKPNTRDEMIRAWEAEPNSQATVSPERAPARAE